MTEPAEPPLGTHLVSAKVYFCTTHRPLVTVPSQPGGSTTPQPLQPTQPQRRIAPYARLKASGRFSPKARLKQGTQPRQVTQREDLTHQAPQTLQRRGACSPSQISLPSYTDGCVRRNASTLSRTRL